MAVLHWLTEQSQRQDKQYLATHAAILKEFQECNGFLKNLHLIWFQNKAAFTMFRTDFNSKIR